jgi:hypothetical protein
MASPHLEHFKCDWRRVCVAILNLSQTVNIVSIRELEYSDQENNTLPDWLEPLSPVVPAHHELDPD